MLSKSEKQQLNTEFWTAFRVYMRKHTAMAAPGSNWINYNTGLRDIFIRLKVEPKLLHFSIELQFKNEGIRELVYEQFLELKKVIHEVFGTELNWESKIHDQQNLKIAIIGNERYDLNYIDKNKWMEIFAFLEHHLLAFDSFWLDWKDVFVQLIK